MQELCCSHCPLPKFNVPKGCSSQVWCAAGMHAASDPTSMCHPFRSHLEESSMQWQLHSSCTTRVSRAWPFCRPSWYPLHWRREERKKKKKREKKKEERKKKRRETERRLWENWKVNDKNVPPFPKTVENLKGKVKNRTEVSKFSGPVLDFSVQSTSTTSQV